MRYIETGDKSIKIQESHRRNKINVSIHESEHPAEIANLFLILKLKL